MTREDLKQAIIDLQDELVALTNYNATSYEDFNIHRLNYDKAMIKLQGLQLQYQTIAMLEQLENETQTQTQ